MSIDFLAIGELLADMITIDYTDELSNAKSFEIFQGGSPANVAANVQFMGKKAALVSCIGNDGIGKFLKNELIKAGINDRYLQVSKIYPTSLILVTRTNNTPDFIAYRMADAQLQAIDKKVIKSAGIIHTTAFALSIQPARDVIMQAMEYAIGYNKTISVDWNFAPSVWKEDKGIEVFEKLMKMKPVVKLSADDLERFMGGIKNIDEYKTYLDKYNCALICITCGKDGVWYKEAGQKWTFKESTKVIEVKDSTGAGDAFWAGFICSFIDKLPVKDCIDNALKMAAEKIEKKGPIYSS